MSLGRLEAHLSSFLTLELEPHEGHPLWMLEQRMLSIMLQPNLPSFVQLKILQALIWLSFPSDTTALEDNIVKAIAVLPSQLFNGIPVLFI